MNFRKNRVKLNVTKLLQTSGLVRKKVLVRRKGGKPFWSTRWVQEGQDVKEVVRSLGFEVVEEDKPEVKKDIYEVPEIIKEKVPDIGYYLDSKTKEINDLNEKLTNLTNLVESLSGQSNIDDQVNIDGLKQRIRDVTNNRKSMEQRVLKELSKREEKNKIVIKPEPKVTIFKPDVDQKVNKIPQKFVAAKTNKEVYDRLDKFIGDKGNKLQYHECGVNFDKLSLKHQNSILEGIEKIIGKYGIKLDYIGWNSKKQKSIAKYSYFQNGMYKSIQFQKTATKNVKKRQADTPKRFESHKKESIEKYMRYLTYKEMRPGDRDRNRNSIAKLNACHCWTVDADSDNMLMATTIHECNHAIYYEFDLKSKWENNLAHYVGNDMNNNIKCATVSEYGMSSTAELFAEVGTAVELGLKIDVDVKRAYLETIEGIN